MGRILNRSNLVQGTVISVFASITGFFVYTKHCEVQEPLSPSTEPLFTSPSFRKYNPHNNHVSSDAIIRRIPLSHLRPDLLENAQYGDGSKLTEFFCASIWSGATYTPQRLIHGRNKPESSLPPPDPSAPEPTSSPILNEVAAQSKSSWSRLTSVFSSSTPPQPTTSIPTRTPSKPTEPLDLWSPTSLRASTYPIGTCITNHFLVLSHTPSAIVVRCGSSPLDSPHSPRSSDGLFEISATTNFEKGYAEFKLKSLFYNGTEEAKGGTGEKDWKGKVEWWLHQQYAKLWMESAVGSCKLSHFRSMEKQRRQIMEEVKGSEK